MEGPIAPTLSCSHHPQDKSQKEMTPCKCVTPASIPVFDEKAEAFYGETRANRPHEPKEEQDPQR